jgi:hypothetical protein
MASKLDTLSVTSDAVDVLTEAAQLIATTEPLARPTQTDRIKRCTQVQSEYVL